MRREERINDWIEWVAEGRSNSNSTHTSFRTTKAKLKLVEWIASGTREGPWIRFITSIPVEVTERMGNIITVAIIQTQRNH